MIFWPFWALLKGFVVLFFLLKQILVFDQLPTTFKKVDFTKPRVARDGRVCLRSQAASFGPCFFFLLLAPQKVVLLL